MKSLQEIAIKQVCLNLNFNYELCKKFNWKIPKKIGNEILESAIKYSKPLNDDQCCIFQNNILELSEFLSHHEVFNVKSYDFLNGHEFDNLYFKNITKFDIENPNFKVKTKNFTFSQVKIKNFDWNNFFQNSVQVEESLKIEKMSNNPPFDAVCGLIEKSAFKLKSFMIKDKEFDENHLKKLSKEISKLHNLEKFKFNVLFDLKCENHGNIIINSLFNTAENLQILKINFLCSYSTLLLLIKNINNLKNLKIHFNSCKELNVQADIFAELRERLSHKLQRINFLFVEINKKGRNELLKLLNECKCLEKIKVVFLENRKSFSQCIIEKLFNSAKTLKAFYITPSFQDKYIKDVKRLFESCTSLVKINLKTTQRVDEILPSVNIGIENSKNTLREIQIHDFDAEQLKLYLPKVMEIVCLERFTIEESSFCDETLKILHKLIDTHRHNLRELDLSNCFQYCDIPIDFLKSLSKCSNMISFDLSICNLRGKVKYVINNSCAFLENLETLYLSSAELGDEDVEELSEMLLLCKSLSILDLSGNGGVSTSASEQFTRNVGSLRPYLYLYAQPGISDDELESDEDYYEYDYEDDDDVGFDYYYYDDDDDDIDEIDNDVLMYGYDFDDLDDTDSVNEIDYEDEVDEI